MSQAATYRYGNKNNWRRWAWNRIAEHCPVPKAEARVLYMPGPEDNDRELAKRHGFKDWNLIGVDSSRAIVDHHRRDGKIMVHGDAMDVMYNGLASFDVMLLDFLGDIPPLLFDACASVPGGRVVCLNVLRGRTGPVTKSHPLWLAAREASVKRVDLWTENGLLPAAPKLHRGQIVSDVVLTIWHIALMHHYGMLGQSGGGVGKRPTFDSATRTLIKQRWTHRHFHSYRSQAGLVYDSIVFAVDPSLGEFCGCADWQPCPSVRRKIAAAKALSTMQRRPNN